MYRRSYAEVLADSHSDARAVERSALERAVMLLELAHDSGPTSAEGQKALEFTTQLWHAFIKDLNRPDNDLPSGLRQNLIGVGLGVLSEAGRLAKGQSSDFRPLAEICGIIRDGLA